MNVDDRCCKWKQSHFHQVKSHCLHVKKRVRAKKQTQMNNQTIFALGSIDWLCQSTKDFHLVLLLLFPLFPSRYLYECCSFFLVTLSNPLAFVIVLISFCYQNIVSYLQANNISRTLPKFQTFKIFRFLKNKKRCYFCNLPNNDFYFYNIL